MQKLGNDAGRRPGIYRRFPTTIQAVVLLALLIGYPNLAAQFNAPPDVQALQTVDFPGALQGIYFGRWSRFTLVARTELQALVGCPAELRVDRLRFLVIPTNPRVWSLRCPGLFIPYSRMRQYYRTWESGFQPGHWFVGVGAALLVLAALTRDLSGSRK